MEAQPWLGQAEMLITCFYISKKTELFSDMGLSILPLEVSETVYCLAGPCVVGRSGNNKHM